MKKIFLFILIALITFSTTVCAQEMQETQTVYVPEASMNIQIPSGWETLTPALLESDPIFEEIGLDYNEFLETMKQNSIVLDAFDPNTGSDILVVVQTTKDTLKCIDYRLMSKKEEQKVLNVINKSKDKINEKLSGDVELEDVSISNTFENEQAKYFYLNRRISSQDGSITNSYGAFTIVDKKSVLVTLSVYDEEITQEQKNQINNIINNIKFDQSVQDTYNATKKKSKAYSLGYLTAHLARLLFLVLIIYIIMRIIKNNKRKKSNDYIKHNDIPLC